MAQIQPSPKYKSVMTFIWTGNWHCCDSTSMTEGSILAALSAIVATRTTHCPVPLHRLLSNFIHPQRLHDGLIVESTFSHLKEAWIFNSVFGFPPLWRQFNHKWGSLFLNALCGFLPKISFSWVCLEKVPIRLGDKGGTSECSTWIPWKNYTLFINSRAGRQYRGYLAELWRNAARHGMFILNIFLLKTSILRLNYVVYLLNKQNIFLLIINWLIDWLKLINEYYGIFFLRFQGSKVWIIVLNKANSPIYDDKQCYDNRNDDVGNELDNLK